MATSTLKIYADRCTQSDGNAEGNEVSNTFRVDYKTYTDVHFTIPSEINSYLIKSLNVYLALGYANGAGYYCNVIGEGIDRTPSFNNKEYTAITPNASNIDKYYTTKELSYKFDFYSQFPVLYFGDNISKNPPYIEIEYIEPKISNFTISGSSIDSNIVCTWEAEDIETWEVQAIQNNIIVSKITGTSETTCTFPIGTFSNSGTTQFKIVGYGSGNSIEDIQTVDLIQTVPQIIAIEPNGVLKLLTNPIDIEFTGTNITSFVMNVYQNNINKFTFSGTTERKATVIANVFSSGTVTIEIVAKYVCAYYETSTTRSVTFTAYGPPPNPILNIESTYNTPFPLIKWSSSEQLSYQIKIDTLDTGEIYSNDKMYQVNEALTNYTYYAVSLRIKNQYNLWSEWVTSTIYIDFAELSQPEFNIYADTEQACIVINIQSPEDVNFCYHEVYRRESNVWVKIATDIERIGEYKDFACASNITYDYKVRAITTVGGYTDSLIKEMQCNFKGNILSVPFTDVTFNVIHSKEETGIQKSTSLLVDRKFVVYCGCEKPKETRGLTKYRQFSLSTTFKTLEDYLEFEKLTSERVVLFRDNKGTKAYCSLAITGITDEKTFYATVDLSLTEVYYKEGDYSEAESRPLRFIDEEW